MVLVATFKGTNKGKIAIEKFRRYLMFNNFSYLGNHFGQNVILSILLGWQKK